MFQIIGNSLFHVDETIGFENEVDIWGGGERGIVKLRKSEISNSKGGKKKKKRSKSCC